MKKVHLASEEHGMSVEDFERHEWECLGKKWKGDVGGEELEQKKYVTINPPYKKGKLAGCTHAILVGNRGGRMATIRFFNIYLNNTGVAK